MTPLSELGGSALCRTAQSEGLSWVPPDAVERDLDPGSVLSERHIDGEPPSAMFTTYAPPHAMSLTGDEVDRLLDRHAGSVKPPDSPHRASSADVAWSDLPDHERLVEILVATNAVWWRLELTTVNAVLLRYRPDTEHGEHIDMHPGTMQRKLALSIQLSDSDDYEGGDLQLRCYHELHTMPRLRGSVVAFPGWVPHRVTPVESGDRWVLVVWAWGPPVR